MEEFDDLIERFDHVAACVADIAAAMPLMRLLGGTFLQGGDNTRGRFRWVQFLLPGDAKMELLQPLEGNDFLVRFLDKHGEGLHHITLMVRDVDAAAERARRLGFRTTGLHLHPQWSEVFVHPSSTHGVLVQFARSQAPKTWAGPGLDEVLTGRSLDES